MLEYIIKLEKNIILYFCMVLINIKTFGLTRNIYSKHQRILKKIYFDNQARAPPTKQSSW